MLKHMLNVVRKTKTVMHMEMLATHRSGKRRVCHRQRDYFGSMHHWERIMEIQSGTAFQDDKAEVLAFEEESGEENRNEYGNQANIETMQSFEWNEDDGIVNRDRREGMDSKPESTLNAEDEGVHNDERFTLNGER